MRKRTSKPQRFAAVENDSIDQLPSLLSVGLLTRLIRAQDGDDVTVDSLCQQYSEGETALSKAMRILVEGAYVVKFKVQRANTEVQLDDEGEAVLDDKGKPIVKRGGSWYTTFQVDAHGKPFTAEEVAAELAAILASGNIKAVRVEPERLDPRKADAPAAPAPTRPTPGNPRVGQESEFPQVGPTPGFPGVGQTTPGRPTPHRPGVGQAGALYRKKTVLPTDSLSSPSSDSQADEAEPTGEREKDPALGNDNPTPVPQQRGGQAPDIDAVDLVLAGWATGAGLKLTPASVREQLTGQIAELAAEYATPDELRAVAEFAGRRRWFDLGRAALHPECVQQLALVRPRPAHSAPGGARCPDHPSRYRKGCVDCAMAVPA